MQNVINTNWEKKEKLLQVFYEIRGEPEEEDKLHMAYGLFHCILQYIHTSRFLWQAT